MAASAQLKYSSIGGTGPTGPYIVNGLLQRDYRVAILHRGSHEVDEIPPEVEHIHTDPYEVSALETALRDRRFDVCHLVGPRGTAWHRHLGSQGYPHHRGIGGRGGLQDAVYVVQPVAVGRDVLGGDRQHQG